MLKIVKYSTGNDLVNPNNWIEGFPGSTGSILQLRYASKNDDFSILLVDDCKIRLIGRGGVALRLSMMPNLFYFVFIFTCVHSPDVRYLKTFS